MNSTVRNLLIVAAVVLGILLFWKYCTGTKTVPTVDTDPVPDTTSIVDPGPAELDPDTGAGAPSYPTYPEAGEKTDIDFGGSATVYDRPCLYISKGASGKFKVIDVVIPHAAGKKWVLASGSPTTSGGVLTFTFNEQVVSGGAAGLTVFVDPPGVRSMSGISKVRAVAVKSGGGGSDDDDVVVTGADDESAFPTWTSGMPFLWHKESGSNVIVGGFIYGMGGNKPTTASGPTPNPGTPGLISLATTTVSAGNMYQAIPQKTFANATGTNWYKAECTLSTSVPDRSFNFQR